MCAYIMVEPTKLKPRFFMSLLIVSEAGDVAGICDVSFHLLTIGLPSMNAQMYLSKEPNSFCTFKNVFAFETADATFKRLRMMPSFCKSFSILLSVYLATLFTS